MIKAENVAVPEVIIFRRHRDEPAFKSFGSKTCDGRIRNSENWIANASSARWTSSGVLTSAKSMRDARSCIQPPEPDDRAGPSRHEATAEQGRAIQRKGHEAAIAEGLLASSGNFPGCPAAAPSCLLPGTESDRGLMRGRRLCGVMKDGSAPQWLSYTHVEHSGAHCVSDETISRRSVCPKERVICKLS